MASAQVVISGGAKETFAVKSVGLNITITIAKQSEKEESKMKRAAAEKKIKTEIEMDDRIVDKSIREILVEKLLEIKQIRIKIKEYKKKEKERKSIIDAFTDKIRETSPFDRYCFSELANIDYEQKKSMVLDEEKLMQEGVPADVIRRCKVEKKGKPYFKISFVGMEEDEE